MGDRAQRVLTDARLMTLLVMLVVGLPLVGVRILALRQSADGLRSQQATELASAAQAVARNERDRLDRLGVRVAATWGNTPAAAFADDETTKTTLAEAGQRVGSDLVGIALADGAGRILVSQPAGFGTAVSSDAMRPSALDGSPPVSRFAQFAGKTFFVLSVPVSGQNRVVLVGVSAGSALRDMQPLLGVFGVVYLVDSGGTTLSVSRYALHEDFTRALDDATDLLACCSVALGETSDTTNVYGEAPVASGTWRIVVGQPKTDVQASIDTVGRALLGTGAVPLALLFVATFLLTRALERIARQRDRLRDVQETGRIGGWRWDLKTARLDPSDELIRMLDLAPRPWSDSSGGLLARVAPDDRDRVQAAFARAIETRTPVALRCRVLGPAGESYIMDIRAAGETDARGRWIALRGTAQDVSQLYRTEAQMTLLAAEVDSIDEAVVVTTLDGTITEWNAGAERLFGYTRSEAFERSIRMLRPAGCDGPLGPKIVGIREGRSVRREEIQRARKDGSIVEVAAVGTPVWNAAGEVVAAAWTYTDITRKKHLEQELAERAMHDPLTGLANRFLLRDRLEQALRGGERSGEPVAFLEIDIERFRDVNEAIGQQGGDALLMDVAARLQAQVRGVDTVARLGTDLFAIVVPGGDETAAVLVASRLRDLLQAPFTYGRHEVDVAVNVGVAIAPSHGNDVATLLRRCEIALGAAKRSRAGYALYAPDAESEKPSRVIVLSELRQAIERNELRLDYQPEVDLRTGETVRVEALLRWMHPTRGLVAPLDFIPVVEDTGLIGPVTRWVVAEAARQCRAWEDAGRSIPVAVNFSTRSLLEPEMVDAVRDCLQAAALPGEMLTIEITEGVLMSDARRAREVIDGLHSLGVRIALDDFGTGYSSFAYLDTLPIDEMKIDRSFVLGLERERGRAIVGTMIDLAHHLGAEVIAEGVEGAAVSELLSRLGCDTVQGFSAGRPMSPAALEGWLRERGEHVGRARRTVVKRIAGSAPAA